MVKQPFINIFKEYRLNLTNKTRPFNLEEALLGLPIVTRSGKKIQVLKYDDLKNKLWIKHSPEEEYEPYFLDGKYHYNLTCEVDLFMGPITKTEIYFAVKEDGQENISFIPAKKIKEFKDPIIIQNISVDVPISKEEWLELNKGTSKLTKIELVNADILTFKDLLDMVDRMKEQRVPIDTPLYFMSRNQKEFALKNEVILTTVGERKRGTSVSEMKREEFKFPSNLKFEEFDKLCFRINIEKKE